MPSLLDLSLYIPVICMQVDSPKYKGRCFMEAILKVQMLNGESISPDRRLVKADFSSDDEVVIYKIQEKDFCGFVDFSCDEETVFEWVDSPANPSPSQEKCSAIIGFRFGACIPLPLHNFNHQEKETRGGSAADCQRLRDSKKVKEETCSW